MKFKEYRGARPNFSCRFKQLTINYVDDVMAPQFEYQTDSVDYKLFHGDPVTLADETEEYLYTEYTPLKINYEKGSRPALEKIVSEIVAAGMPDREKALAVMRFCRDIPDRKPGAKREFDGGTEEEVIEAGSAMCGEQCRVFCCLAQIAGMPARIALSYGCPDIHGKLQDGHAINEVWVEGRWAYMDIRGRRVEWPNGRLASVRDLMLFPELFSAQPEHVCRDFRRGYDLKIQVMFCPRRIIRLSNYFVWENSKYKYPHYSSGQEEQETMRRKQEEIDKQYRERFAAEGLIFPGA